MWIPRAKGGICNLAFKQHFKQKAYTMGAWGEGIYDDDEALDLRDTIRLLSKIPLSGDAIVDILLNEFEHGENLDDDGCPTFWIVVADQFEKKGISCPRAFELAIRAIETGADINDLQSRGMEDKGLVNREKITANLLPRLQLPRDKKRSQGKNPMRNCAQAGQIYTFPTMGGTGFNAWFPSWERSGFQPDGWGALVIVETGLVFDWYPYCSYSALVVRANRKPSLEDALNSKTMFRDGVAYCLPRPSHFKKMQMELLGTFDVDQAKARQMIRLSDRTPKRAVLCDWSICSGALGATGKHVGYFPVRKLLR